MGIPEKWHLLPNIPVTAESISSDGLLIGKNNQYGLVDIRVGSGSSNSYVLLYKDNYYGGTYIYRTIMVSKTAGTLFGSIWRPLTYSDALYTVTASNYRGTWYYVSYSTPGMREDLGLPVSVYDSYSEAIASLDTATPPDFQISYIPVNCQLSGPSTANSGNSVTIQVTPNEGHVISLPQQGGSISVYNENGYIPFTWDATNKTITFTAP